jgi:MYXO-CTERM domain-containing protein
MKTAATLSAVVLSIVAGAPAASGAIQVADLGTAAPPATLGGYTLVPFGDDARPNFIDVPGVSVPDGAPFGGITFSPDLNKRSIGDGWATWSNGYTGDVYFSNGATSISIALPAGTGAFYFYAEPDPFDTFSITATANDGTSLTVPVAGQAGANGYGFYTDGPALTSITVSSSVAFAVGEFGIARVPTPGSGALALAGLGLIARRRR